MVYYDFYSPTARELREWMYCEVRIGNFKKAKALLRVAQRIDDVYYAKK